MILELAEALLTTLLSDWLTMADVAHLDSAFCSTAHRRYFLSAAYNATTLLRYPSTEDFSVRTYMWDIIYNAISIWMLRKGAVASGLHVSETIINKYDRRLQYLTQHGRCIQWIQYGRYCEFDSECLSSAKDIAQCCPNLRIFKGWRCQDESVLTKIAQCCPLLEEISGFVNCTSQAVLDLSKGCRNLKRVELECPKLDEDCMIALVLSNPGLLSLCTYATVLTDKFLHELALTCTNLTELKLVGIRKWLTQSALHFLLQHTQLSKVHLEDCSFSSPEDSCLPPPVISSRMRTLSVDGTDLEEDQLNALLHACPHLTRLELSNCEDFMVLNSLLIGTNCPCLQELSINYESAFHGDEMLLDLSAHCAQLRVLHISTCTPCQVTALPVMAARCPLLHTVKIASCDGVSDDFLFALAGNCRDLHTLRLPASAEVTDAGIDAVLRGCPSVRDFDVHHLSKISKACLKRVEKMLRNL